MKKRVRTTIILSMIAGILLLYVTYKSVGIVSVLSRFKNATLGSIIGFLLVSTTLAILLAYKWMVIIRSQGENESLSKLLNYRMISFAISYVTPSAKVGGEPFRGYLLSKQGHEIEKSMSSVVIDKAIELLVHITVFSLGSLLIINTLKLEMKAKIMIGILTIIIIALTTILSRLLISQNHKVFKRLFRILNLHRIKKLKKIEEQLIKIEQEVEDFHRNQKRVFKIEILLNIATWVLMYFEYYFALKIIGHNGTPIQIFLLLTGVAIAYLIPVPMAFGFLELSQVGIAALIGLPAAIGLGLGVIIRARDLIWTFIGGLFLMKESFHQSSD